MFPTETMRLPNTLRFGYNDRWHLVIIEGNARCTHVLSAN
ncbi:hypothetical protein [Caudoviricetes sp.]|nr:hypothetical protein [Caudoviricetes sp.]